MLLDGSNLLGIAVLATLVLVRGKLVVMNIRLDLVHWGPLSFSMLFPLRGSLSKQVIYEL